MKDPFTVAVWLAAAAVAGFMVGGSILERSAWRTIERTCLLHQRFKANGTEFMCQRVTDAERR